MPAVAMQVLHFSERTARQLLFLYQEAIANNNYPNMALENDIVRVRKDSEAATASITALHNSVS